MQDKSEVGHSASGNPDWQKSSKTLPQMTQIDADKNTKNYLRDLRNLRAKWDGRVEIRNPKSEIRNLCMGGRPEQPSRRIAVEPSSGNQSSMIRL